MSSVQQLGQRHVCKMWPPTVRTAAAAAAAAAAHTIQLLMLITVSTAVVLLLATNVVDAAAAETRATAQPAAPATVAVGEVIGVTSSTSAAVKEQQEEREDPVEREEREKQEKQEERVELEDPVEREELERREEPVKREEREERKKQEEQEKQESLEGKKKEGVAFHATDERKGRSSSSGNSNSGINDAIAAAQSANLVLHDAQHQGRVVNLTRQHEGDVFRSSGVTRCNADTCVGLSSGTAGLVQLGGGSNDRVGSPSVAGAADQLAGGLLSAKRAKSPAAADAAVGRSCDCRCLPYLSTYREDLGICVDDIHECTLSPFVSGSSSEKIPFVFLPLRGQIIYPSREISFAEIRTPVCAVTGAQFLTANGWTDLRNPIDSDYPFRMFRDEGRTFLQWLGEADLRHKMQGRLIVVHLVCRDMTLALNASAAKDQVSSPPRNVFSPCVAFRVNGSPVKFFHNVSEVLFQAEATATLASAPDGMSTREYAVIAACSLLLALIYVSSVFLYLHTKKRRSRERSHVRGSGSPTLADLANEINYPKNDQVTFGAPFHRSGSLYSGANESRARASIGSAVGVRLKEEMGVVKSNPLLQHFAQLGEHHAAFASDASNSNSECETDGSNYHDQVKQLQTSAVVHPASGCTVTTPRQSPPGEASRDDSESPVERCSSPSQESECLPEAHVAIVEELMTEERLEQMRQMMSGGTIRKKLYFNPAYFEPHLLAQPPPAALEFLTKIREVISIAKYKMATKRYQPSLNAIPEEGAAGSSSASLYSSQLQMSGTDGCRGCAANRCTGHAKNCGDKRNSIEKWLQSVSPDEAGGSSASGAAEGPSGGGGEQRQEEPQSAAAGRPSERRRSPPAKNGNQRSTAAARKEISAPKQRPPPPPPKPGARNNCDSPPSSPSPPRPHVIEIRNNTPYEEMSSCIQTNSGTCTTITVNSHTCDAFAAGVYKFAEMGSELYNNPKFVLHDSPAPSHRSTRSSTLRSKCSHKRLDALEQYAAASTPTSLAPADREHYEMLRSMKQQPDATYDTLARDYSATLASSGSSHLDIPTPDYDSTMEKKSRAPSVPTPDYSTLSRKSLRQSQPDSPIYRRKSPAYLIVDYETDSLDRPNAAKHKSSQSSSSPSSDVSSQLSPSLSTALPLEEELEVSHAVYEKADEAPPKDSQSQPEKPEPKSAKGDKKRKEAAARIKYDTPFLGSMTIEVQHEPPSDLELSTDSDQYEPHSLERKPKQQSFCDVHAWTAHLQKAQHFANASAGDGKSGEEAMMSHQSLQKSLPSLVSGDAAHTRQPRDSPLYVRHVVNDCIHMRQAGNAQQRRASFDSLREIYQPKFIRKNIEAAAAHATAQQTAKTVVDVCSETGRLLTLEAKHTRRQRVTAPLVTPPAIETEVVENKTTIKIKTPNLSRTQPPPTSDQRDFAPANSNRSSVHNTSTRWTWNQNNSAHALVNGGRGTPAKKPPPASPPPPPPPPSSASTTLNSRHSNSRSQAPFRLHHHPAMALYQNHSPAHCIHPIAAEEETASNHSESTEFTRVSDTQATSEFDCSASNTLNSVAQRASERHATALPPSVKSDTKMSGTTADCPAKESHSQPSKSASPPLAKKPQNEADYNSTYNGLRGDYSLHKYLNRRKSQDHQTEDNYYQSISDSSKLEAAAVACHANSNTTKTTADSDSNRLDAISLSSRSNRSSSRLSDRTKELYRNAGVPVGIAYPQRSSASSGTTATTNVQTVYRCEIEPVQLTHGMQIAMGLKDRAKKAKDIKNAWKKFVSMAAAKFSPTASPAPPFEKKAAASFLEALERDDGISSLLDEQPQPQPQVSSTTKSSYSAPASQNYYEQRFGASARLQELDSGYMSADSSEMYKRSFYDRYNFRMMCGRDRVIRVDTIEDNSDSGSATTERHAGSHEGGGGGCGGAEGGCEAPAAPEDCGDGGGDTCGERAVNAVDSNRFDDLVPPTGEELEIDLEQMDDCSDAESDKTLTHANEPRVARGRMGGTSNLYSSEDDRGPSPSYGSSETDGETNAEDMWESGAESIETHSVLYKNVRKS